MGSWWGVLIDICQEQGTVPSLRHRNITFPPYFLLENTECRVSLPIFPFLHKYHNGTNTSSQWKAGVPHKTTHISTFQFISPLYHFDRQAINLLYWVCPGEQRSLVPKFLSTFQEMWLLILLYDEASAACWWDQRLWNEKSCPDMDRGKDADFRST
jgi:hypothetical protein